MASRAGARARAIYERQGREGAIHQGTYSSVALLVAAAVWIFNGPRWIAWVFTVVGGYFLIGCAVDLLKYRQNRNQAPARNGGAASEQDEESDDVVERLDLGGQVLRFSYAPSLLDTHRECIDLLRNSITSKGSGFFEEFSRFKEDQARKYPKYAEDIADLQIESVIVFRARGKSCLGRVRFAGDLDEVWSADYVNGAFSDLIWN